MYIFKICVCVVETILKCVETHQIPISQCLCLCILFFSLIFVPLIYVYSFHVSRASIRYFIAIFDVKMLMRNEKVLIKPENFSFQANCLNEKKENLRKCKHSMIVYLVILVV